VPSNYTGVFRQFGASYPFVDVGNKYVISGSFYFPDLITGKNWTQVAQLLSSKGMVYRQMTASANAITAAICKVTSSSPDSVCGSSGISGLTASLAAYNPPLGAPVQTDLLLADPFRRLRSS
jgi:hypothetical protein